MNSVYDKVRIYLPLSEVELKTQNRLFPEDNKDSETKDIMEIENIF